MPYAAKDRQEFIKRSGIVADMRVLDFGGSLSAELPSAVSGITTPKKMANAVLIKSEHLPFKDSVFHVVLSYHYFDLISPESLGTVFKEIARVLGKESSLSFTITLWVAENEAQKSSLFFNELLKSTGALFQYEIEDVSMKLSAAGFSEITVESVKRGITVPKEFVRTHIISLGTLVKKEKAVGGTGIKRLAKQYYEHVKTHGEAMLPALHFTAKKL